MIPSLFIEVNVPSQECEPSYICVLGVSILPQSTLFISWFLEMIRQCFIFIFFNILFISDNLFLSDMRCISLKRDMNINSFAKNLLICTYDWNI